MDQSQLHPSVQNRRNLTPTMSLLLSGCLFSRFGEWRVNYLPELLGLIFGISLEMVSSRKSPEGDAEKPDDGVPEEVGDDETD